MKNLMPGSITILRQDGTRVHLPSCDHPPYTVLKPGAVVRQHGDLEILHAPYHQVIFPEWADDPKGRPYIVTREIFDLLPNDATEFITPDLSTAVFNGLGVAHVISRFLVKPTATDIVVKQPTTINNT